VVRYMGMKQAGYIANKDLTTYLASHNFISSPSTPCLFRHATDDIEFTLITDDFLVLTATLQSLKIFLT
jgi:hypothetical protein